MVMGAQNITWKILRLNKWYKDRLSWNHLIHPIYCFKGYRSHTETVGLKVAFNPFKLITRILRVHASPLVVKYEWKLKLAIEK